MDPPKRLVMGHQHPVVEYNQAGRIHRDGVVAGRRGVDAAGHHRLRVHGEEGDHDREKRKAVEESILECVIAPVRVEEERFYAERPHEHVSHERVVRFADRAEKSATLRSKDPVADGGEHRQEDREPAHTPPHVLRGDDLRCFLFPAIVPGGPRPSRKWNAFVAESQPLQAHFARRRSPCVQSFAVRP